MENQIIVSKQLRNEYRAYRITKVWKPYHFYDLESLTPSEFNSYDKISSVHIEEMCMIGCEYMGGWGIFKMDLLLDDYEYALTQIGKEVEIEIKSFAVIEKNNKYTSWNYPICKIIKYN